MDIVAQSERNWLGRPSARRRPEEKESPVNPGIDRDEEKNWRQNDGLIPAKKKTVSCVKNPYFSILEYWPSEW